jgi:hypothetical protein
MNPTITALRAITAVTLRRILLPLLWVGAGILILAYALTVFLSVGYSGWWTLLLVLLIPLTLVGIVVGVGLWIASGKLFPRSYDKKHKKPIIAFTDKIMGLVENSKTPYPIHLFLIGKDIIRGKESSHLKGMIDDSSSLRRDFDEIRKLF